MSGSRKNADCHVANAVPAVGVAACTALQVAETIPLPDASRELRQSPLERLRDWDPEAQSPTVSLAEAQALLDDDDNALLAPHEAKAAAVRMLAAYPAYTRAIPEEDLALRIEDYTEILSAHHRSSVIELVRGRQRITLQHDAPPNLKSVEDALVAITSRKRAVRSRAQLAIAVLAADEVPSVRTDRRWRNALRLKDGVAALRLVKAAAKPNEDTGPAKA